MRPIRSLFWRNGTYSGPLIPRSTGNPVSIDSAVQVFARTLEGHEPSTFQVRSLRTDLRQESDVAARARNDKRAWLMERGYRVLAVEARAVETDLPAVLDQLAKDVASGQAEASRAAAMTRPGRWRARTGRYRIGGIAANGR